MTAAVIEASPGADQTAKKELGGGVFVMLPVGAFLCIFPQIATWRHDRCLEIVREMT